MIKVIRASMAMILAGGAAYAGSVAFDAPVLPEVIEESGGSMGGSGMWLIPLLVIALIMLVANNNSNGTL